MHKHTTVVEVPFTEWHKLASEIIIAGAIVASGFYQCQAPDGNVWTYSDYIPAIFAGDVILTPAPVVP